MVTEYGAETGQVKKYTQKQLLDIKELLNKTFNAKVCTKQWNSEPNLWFHVEFFPSTYYLEQSRLIIPENNIKIVYKIQPYIKIFSNQKDGCTITDLNKNVNFDISTLQPQSFGKKKFTSSSVEPASLVGQQYQQRVYRSSSSTQRKRKQRVPSRPLKLRMRLKKREISFSQILKMYWDIKRL